VQKLAELIEFACCNFTVFQNGTFNVGCHSGNVQKQNIINLIAKYANFTCDIVLGADADTRDYNVSYDKLKAVWPDYNDTFSEHLANIVEYYKKW
jgi:hypothetical protein